LSLKWLTLEGFLKLFVLIGRNSQGVGTSPFATYVTNVEKLEIPGDEKKALLDNIDHIYEVMSAGKCTFWTVLLIPSKLNLST